MFSGRRGRALQWVPVCVQEAAQALPVQGRAQAHSSKVSPEPVLWSLTAHVALSAL